MDIAKLDGTIGLFAPDVVAAKRRATRFKRSAYIITGELTRRCMDVLRETGEPVAIDAIAVATLRDKGLDPSDKALREDFGRRPREAEPDASSGQSPSSATVPIPDGDIILAKPTR